MVLWQVHYLLRWPGTMGGGRCHIMRPNNIKYDRTMGPNSDRLDMVRTECSQTQPRAGGFSSVFRQFFVFFTDNMFMGRIFWENKSDPSCFFLRQELEFLFEQAMVLHSLEILSHIQWNRPWWMRGWRNCNYNNNHSYSYHNNYNNNCYRWTTDYTFPIKWH